MLYQSMFAGDLFSRMDRLQPDLQQNLDLDLDLDLDLNLDLKPSIRGGFFALNLGSTPNSVEFCAFVPRLEAASIDVHFGTSHTGLQWSPVDVMEAIPATH